MLEGAKFNVYIVYINSAEGRAGPGEARQRERFIMDPSDMWFKV
jgi:hypothetical protein